VLGIELSPVSNRERLISLVGGMLSVPALYAISRLYVEADALVPVVASMGASAVLLFAVPHGTLSQPWPLLGGHIVSALVGVTCAEWLGTSMPAAALAVGLAIGTMHYLRCLHPPGGATALVAVIGGPAVTSLGYQYVVTPVTVNALVMFMVALAFNAPFAWRRYPAWLYERTRPPVTEPVGAIRHEDFVYALSQLDTFVDVSEDDLLQIYALATGRHPRGEASAGCGGSRRFTCSS